MSAIRLTDDQRTLIPAIALNADMPIARLAKTIGVRERSLRYNLGQLEERGILKRSPFLNIYPLGYRYVNLYFSVGGGSFATTDQLLQALAKTEKVSWLAELGADFHFGASLIVRDVEEVRDILDGLSKKFPNVFFEKSYVFHLALTVFPPKYLATKKVSFPELGYGSTGTHFEADDLDRKILSVMAEDLETSGRAIARKLGRPHATVEVRLRNLEKAKVIPGYWYLFDASRLGYQTLKILVYAKGHHFELSQKLGQFARQHPNISYFIECLGSWDFELGLDVLEAREVATVSRELLSLFGNFINTVKVVPMFRVIKFRQFSAELS